MDGNLITVPTGRRRRRLKSKNRQYPSPLEGSTCRYPFHFTRDWESLGGTFGSTIAGCGVLPAIFYETNTFEVDDTVIRTYF
jgi:hypothetical protein